MKETIKIENDNQLNDAIALVQRTVYKRYLPELRQYSLVDPKKILLNEKTEDYLQFLRLEELTYKKGEDIFQKLSTVYHASMSLGCNLIVLIDVEKINAPAKIYLGVRSGGENILKNDNLITSFETLKSGITSNFPGTKLHNIPVQEDMSKLLDDIFGEHISCISSVSCVASARDKSKTENKSFIQGLEHFIDAMYGNTYTAVFIAQPISTHEQDLIRNGYETLYSNLSSFHKSVWSYSENESISVMESLSEGVSESMTKGSSHTQAHTTSVGINIGVNSSKSNSDAISHTKSGPTKAARAGQVIGGLADVIGTVGGIALEANPLVGGLLLGGSAVMQGIGCGMQRASISEGIINTIGKNYGLSGGVSAGYAKTRSDTNSETKSSTKSTTNTKGTTKTEGTGKTLQIENINKSVEEMLKRIEEQLQRVQEGEAYGSYSCAAYFLSGKQDSSLLAANIYQALMIGEGSSVESGAINSWKISDNLEENKVCLGIKEYLRKFIHPVFAAPVSSISNEISNFITYTPGTIVSGLELPLHLGFPTRSVYGLPVLEHVEFGRNVTRKTIFPMERKNKIMIGSIYHMGQVEDVPVELDVQGLTSHTFISGSTGSGKSNTIYRILDELKKQKVKFLVVEPAKGEYKDIFGGYDDVRVYGTNPLIMPLLQINPFSFPENIHVLEHIDRLVEVFNACWTMYAAMPAVLKDAIEKSYVRKGWDLNYSICEPREFPTFFDVLDILPEVMNESLYSSDTKSDYAGALITRVRSLTNGINGQVFCSFKEASIENEDLFYHNVIVDLSRIGSMETKSLVMGILIMKLQEYRIDIGGRNEQLSHVTVLEEAHNLLRRTSTIQTQESSNLQGKSVEMISNAIAEMRTYGEGFIIADQAPELLDESVIRNTNTKIIFRMPDESDRMLVGKAAALTDDQISELAKLPQGVAAIYQNDWVEPVLCQFPKFSEENEKPYKKFDKEQKIAELKKQHVMSLTRFFRILFEIHDIGELNKEEVDIVKRWIDTLEYSKDTLDLLKESLGGKKLSENDKFMIAYNVFDGIRMEKILKDNKDEEKGKDAVYKEIKNMHGIKDAKITDIVLYMICEIIFRKESDSDFVKRYQELELARRLR